MKAVGIVFEECRQLSARLGRLDIARQRQHGGAVGFTKHDFLGNLRPLALRGLVRQSVRSLLVVAVQHGLLGIQ